jgi:glycine zipper 2TM protein
MLRPYIRLAVAAGSLVMLAACNHASAEHAEQAAKAAADSARAEGAPPQEVTRRAEHARQNVLAREAIKDSAKAERHEDANARVWSVPRGTELRLASVTDITSQKNKVGDQFIARATTAALSTSGDTVIPVGAELVGHVTALEDAARNGEGRLTVAFDHLRIPQAAQPVQDQHIDVTVTSLGTRYVDRGIDVEDAAKVGVGAAVGAVAGRVIGHNRTGAAAGAVAGGAAGAVYANRTKHRDIVISPGSSVVVTLNDSFTRHDVANR